jgi:hypothetical protein
MGCEVGRRVGGIVGIDTWIDGGEGADGRRAVCIAPPPLLEGLYSVSLSDHLLGKTGQCSVHPAHESQSVGIRLGAEVDVVFWTQGEDRTYGLLTERVER